MDTPNKRLVRRMIEWWTSGDVTVVDETNAPGFVLHRSGGVELTGREAYKEMLASFVQMFSEREITIGQVIEEGDQVVMLYTWSGRHTGTARGMPSSNRRVTCRSLAVYRVADGLIAEEWEEHDSAGLTRQLSGA